MTYKTFFELTVRSTETEDNLPLKEITLFKNFELPIPPQPDLWLKSESFTHNIKVESVAIDGQSVVAYLHPITVKISRVDEIVDEYRENGWR